VGGTAHKPGDRRKVSEIFHSFRHHFYMPRLARVIAIDTAHHVTQRGNAHRFILNSDSDRLVYLDLLVRFSRLYELSLAGYCLMSNHVHLIVVPHRPDSLASALQHAHGRYAAYLNAREASDGHVWQGRYYSCPLDLPHLWAALRYCELNPVRAGLVAQPDRYRWSSAVAHCGGYWPDFLERLAWCARWTSPAWREYLAADESSNDADAIRSSTHTGRPLGTQDFIEQLELTLRRRLTPQKGGRPPRRSQADRQAAIGFQLQDDARAAETFRLSPGL
jgi:putative transposase